MVHMSICKPIIVKENYINLIELNCSGFVPELRTEIYFLRCRYMDKIEVSLANKNEEIIGWQPLICLVRVEQKYEGKIFSWQNRVSLCVYNIGFSG